MAIQSGTHLGPYEMSEARPPSAATIAWGEAAKPPTPLLDTRCVAFLDGPFTSLAALPEMAVRVIPQRKSDAANPTSRSAGRHTEWAAENYCNFLSIPD